MHILDVFFVKYAEQQVDEYMRMIENPERRAEARKAIRASISEGKEEADGETRLGMTPIAVTPIVRREEAADTIAKEQDIFDAGVDSREEDAFAPLPVAAVEVDEDAFEVPETSAPTPEPIVEDVEAEEEEPPEEQIFGESPATVIPEEEQIFGESPEPPAPEAESASEDSWAGEKSLEEFEAEFAQFEGQSAEEDEPETPEEPEAEPAQAEQVGRETGSFFISEPEHEPKPEPEPEPEDEEEDIFDIQAPPAAESERTETQQFDKPSEEEPAEHEAEHDGITGDDVSDAIDNFFKIK
jgi:hypothetical protein